DPFTKKLIIEAILEAVEANLVQGMKDLGGGGLTCGLSEIAAKAGTGLEIDLDKIQTREPNMQPSEIMISESQERMILLVREKDERRLVSILEKWELGYAKIGQVTKDGLKDTDESSLVSILEKWELGYAKIGQVTKDGLLIIRRGS